MPNRNVVAIVVAILLAWVVAGCGVEVESQASRQLDVIGDVEVSTTICATMDSVDSAPGCSPLSSDHRARSLVGYRIPAGSTAPDELESTGDVRLSYVRDAGYGAYLDARYPSDGAHWVGYVSEVHEWAAGEAPRWTVAPRFSLPAAGSPHEGPFEYASVAGYFVPGDGADDSAPLSCDEVSCPDTAPILGSQPTNDLALVSGPSPGIAQNDEGDVPVGLRFAGPERDDARFELSASSDLPGAAVAPRDGSFAPPAGDAGSTSASTERVHVDVPGDARPGLYTVTLTARSGGQVRSGTTEFIVTEKVDPGVAVETATSRQLDVIGDVGIDAGFCTRPDPEVFISAVRPRVAGAADGGRAGCGASQSRQRTQALAAFRIPAGSSAPAALAASGDRDGEYVLDEAYGAGMDARFPPPDGQRWVGYVSSPHSTPAGQVEHWSVSPRFGLPEPGTPYRGPYPFAVASGYRDLAPGGAAGAPVDCAGPHTWCPGPEVVAGQATRDLGVLPGGDPPSIVSGSRGTVPFDLRFAGAAGGGAEFELAASTDLPRASVAVEGSRLVPATDSSNAEGVAVSVPAGTAPGPYTVELGATVADRDAPQSRHGTMTLTVVAPPAPAPPEPAEPEPVAAPAVARLPRPRPTLALTLKAAPRRAYTGARARYRVVARNTSAATAARRTRVCQRLPGRVQYAAASRRVRFSGRDLCFAVGRLRPGGSAAASVYVRVNRDARPGDARARAVVSAANARPARARAALRVVRRAEAPRPAPVTG